MSHSLQSVRTVEPEYKHVQNRGGRQGLNCDTMDIPMCINCFIDIVV